MADNVDFTPGTGATGATDDIGGIHYPRVKISLGGDGTAVDAGAGAGAVGTDTQRVTLGSDDPAVAALQLIDDVVYADDADFTDSTSKGMLAFGLYQSTPQSITDGDVGPVQLDANGRILVGGIIPGSAAAALGKAEDSAHTTADVGVAVLAVRRDAKAVGSDTDGDYSTLNVSPDGDLRVDGGKAFVIKVAPTVTAGAYTADDCMGGEMTVTAAARISGGSGILTGITMVAEDNAADGWAANGVEVLIFDSNPAGTYTDNNALDGSALTDADAFLLLGTVLLDTKVDLGDVTMLKATNVNIPYVCSGSANLFAVAINRGGVTPEATDAIQFTFHVIRD